MRAVWSVALVLIVSGVLALGLQAQAKKEVTFKGTILCAKCALKQGDKCQTAIQVKQDGKEVVYYLDDQGNKEKYHAAVCGGEREQGSVTGVVSERGGKKWIKPSKVVYAKK